MSTKRPIHDAMITGRIAYTQRLFTPETVDMMGKPMDTPMYSVSVLIPKTQRSWAHEPGLRGFAAAAQRIRAECMSAMPAGQIDWRIKDGDLPNRKGSVTEWARGSWVLRASSGYAPTVGAVENGTEVELQAASIGGRQIIKDGDHALVSVAVAQSQSNVAALRIYLNAVLVTSPGEAIVLRQGASLTEMTAAAREQGLLGDAAPSGATPFDDDIPF